MAARIDAVLERLDAAAERSGREGRDLLVLLATKTRTPAEIACAVALMRERGRRIALGENRAQEIAKHEDPALAALDVPRHFIGRLQTNKAKDAVAFASMIHSVDREALIEALERRAELADARLDVLLQVNTSGEDSKAGFAPEAAQLAPVLEHLAASERLTARGLMTIGAHSTDPTRVRASLRRLRELRDELQRPELVELSMGMSDDLETAVEEGSTIVRIGSAVFGPREVAA